MRNIFSRCLIVLMCFNSSIVIKAQIFQSTTETLIKLKFSGDQRASIIGTYDKNPSFLFYNKKLDSTEVYIKYFDEMIGKFFESNVSRTIDSRTFGSYHNFNSYFFYRKLYFESEEDYGYSGLYLLTSNRETMLDSIYNADKKVHTSFSDDGRYLLVNTLNTLSDYYNPEQDDRIAVYDLTQIQQGKIKKEYIPCKHCADSHLVNDTLFFTTSKNEGYEGFYNKAIYMAPWGSLQDSIKIASHTELLAVSPDGKYLLGARFLDRQKLTMVIIDVATKRYQMLLGRDYYQYKPFYSYQEDKFAFNIDGFLVYIDYPKTYPFDALRWRNENIPDFTEEAFWQQFEHEPLQNDK